MHIKYIYIYAHTHTQIYIYIYIYIYMLKTDIYSVGIDELHSCRYNLS